MIQVRLWYDKWDGGGGGLYCSFIIPQAGGGGAMTSDHLECPTPWSLQLSKKHFAHNIFTLKWVYITWAIAIQQEKFKYHWKDIFIVFMVVK